MSPENQKNISDKWFYDSIYYSRQDSQNVANVRLFYKNGKLAARGKVLLNPNKTRVGKWIYYTNEDVGLNVIHDTDNSCGRVIESVVVDFNL